MDLADESDTMSSEEAASNMVGSEIHGDVEAGDSMEGFPALGGCEFPAQEVSNSRTRKLVQNLRGDYDHSWDILAETAQNAVDGIRRKVRQRKIRIFTEAVDKDSDGLIGSDDLLSFHEELGLEGEGFSFEEIIEYPESEEGGLKTVALDKNYEDLTKKLEEELGWDLSFIEEKYEELYGEEQDEIHFVVDKQNRTIEVRDTGTGIDPRIVVRVLAWHETDKLYSDSEIGEKGVGMTYCLFSSNSFELKSKHDEGTVELVVRNAYDWLTNDDDVAPPGPEITKAEPGNPEATGVTICIGGFVPPKDAEYSIFDLEKSALLSVFMTRTAIGQTKALFGSDEDGFHFNLTYIDENGTSTPLPELKDSDHNVIPWRYLTPDLGPFNKPPFETIEYDDFKQFCSNPNVDEKAKKKFMKGKAVTHNIRYDAPDREIQVYACFGQGNDYFDKFSIAKGFHYLRPPDKATEPEEYQQWLGDDADKLYRSGIWLSTKGMPTGIEVPWGDIKVFGKGYFAWMHIVVNDDKLEFGTGRKHVHPGLQKTAKKAAVSLFKEIMPMYNFMQENIPPDPSIKQNSREHKIAKYREFKKLDDLNIDDIKFKKIPKSGVYGQEASVVSIFHELLMAGHLKGYIPLQEGYTQKYDLVADYEIDTSEMGSLAVGSTHPMFIQEKDGIMTYCAPEGCTIEFKVDASMVFEDIENERKTFEDIDLLVCWEINESKLDDNGFVLNEVLEDQIKWYGTTHTLSHNMMQIPAALPIICLSEFIEKNNLNQPASTGLPEDDGDLPNQEDSDEESTSGEWFQ